MVEGAVGGGRQEDAETQVLGAVAPLCFPTAPSAAQHSSWDNVLFPGDRAGHQRSLHLFIFWNISYFERMINNKESEIGTGTSSVLVFFIGKRDVRWAGKRGVSHGKAKRKEEEPKKGAPSYTGMAQPQAAPKGPQRWEGCPKPSLKKDPGIGHCPPCSALSLGGG